VLFIMLSMLTNIVSSCSIIMEGIGSSIAGSTYPSDDADMLAAEAEYSALEAQLQSDMDHYEDNHDYDEYSFELDSIGHDPYVLISTLTAMYDGAWTIDEVRGTLRMLFERQYTLTENVSSTTIHNPENPEAEPQEYRIVDVKLKNNDLSHLPCEILSESQLARYSVYMATLGNRPDLFPGSAYVGRYGEGSYITYEIPPSALEDEAFAAIIAEAEKYLGYPYVWGGSSPSTSFDCSGFVCWVLNHSGWNVGRTTAQGLCNFCTPVRYSDAKLGDLVFFMGTYDTPEVSHVGIYVGNDMMIHCGDPISYSNLNSAYWQEHLYCYGRLPERSTWTHN
jgi:cell wall-associated NlpC family hydrolase